jgi:membrane-anchored glycerophosphoryl diester phosphodiesterase (GDPDase)
VPHGWTPPPKPGLIPLRPLTLGPILGASFQVMRRNPRATLGPALILSVVLTIVTAVGLTAYIGALSRIGFAANDADADALAAGSLVVSLLVFLLGGGAVVVATGVLQALIVTEVARGTVGEKLTLRQLWDRARGRLGAVVGYTLLLILVAAVAITIFFAIIIGITFAVSAGSIGSSTTNPADIMGVMFATLGVILLGYGAALAIALWLGTKLAFVPAAIVLERLPIRAAIVRSWTLTRGYFWRTLGIQLLVAVMISFATNVVTFPISLILSLGMSVLIPTGGSTADPSTAIAPIIIAGIVSSAIVAVVTAVGLVLQSATSSLLYLDLRMRKEGLDLELLRFVEARETGTEVPDPYLPHPQAPAPAAS